MVATDYNELLITKLKNKNVRLGKIIYKFIYVKKAYKFVIINRPNTLFFLKKKFQIIPLKLEAPKH